jgi:hypothetical protein
MTLATRKFADAPFGGRVSEPMNDVISTVIVLEISSPLGQM